MPASVFNKTEVVEDALREASKIRSVVSDAVKDGVRTANQQLRRGRYAAEDMFEETKHTIKQKPVEAVAIAFAAGLLVGSILACALMPRRR